MKIILIACVMLIAGCKTSVERTMDQMVEPVYVAAISEKCGVVLRDSMGDVLVIPSTYVASRPICESFKTGDVFIPAGSDK